MSFNHKRRLKTPERVITEQDTAVLVRSRTGRSRGKIYMVTKLLVRNGSLYACVCDGEARPIENPKLKNASHIEFISHCKDEVNSKLANGILTNEEVKRLVSQNGKIWRD